ncbi:MAG: CHAT domain-containing protein [Lentimicrobiaceae bacterium]|nr:CHAT domain-containing protein [Lentimicrobiaceae bacterium]
MSRIYTLIWAVVISSFTGIYADNVYDKEKVLSWDTCLQLFQEGYRAEIVPSLEILKERAEKNIVFDEEQFASIVEVLGTCYNSLYQLDASRDLFRNAKRIFREKRSHSMYERMCLIGLMAIEMELSNFEQVLAYGYEALRMCSEMGDNGEQYMFLLSLISSGWLTEINYSIWQPQYKLLAKLYIDEALSVYADLGGIGEDGVYPNILSRKAKVEEDLGNFEEAERCYKQALVACKEDYVTYNIILNNLGVLSLKQNKWKESLDFFDKMNLDEDKTIQRGRIGNVLFANYFLADINAIKYYLGQLNSQERLNVVDLLGRMAGKQSESYYDTRASEILFINNMCAWRFNEKEINTQAYDMNLSMRIMGNTLNAMVRKDVLGTENKNAKALFTQIDSLRSVLTYKKILPEERRAIEESLVQKEESLLAYFPDIAEKVLSEIPHFETVKERLQKDEVSLFFCEETSMDSLSFDQEFPSRYIAYVVNSDNDYPIVVDLCDTEDVNKYVEDVDFGAEEISALYASENAQDLYNAIWKKLEPYVEGKTRVYYSTTGFLSTINFEALINENNQRLRDVYDLWYVSSPAMIGSMPSYLNPSEFNTAALWGGISYDMSVRDMRVAAAQSDYFSGTDISEDLALRGETERGSWGALPGTLKEVNYLKGLFQSSGIRPRCYTGTKATEESVKQWNGNSPSILHFATHGFLISTPIQYKENTFATALTAYSEKNRYMLWSGLLLAGSNNRWLGKTLPENVEDGILTADEISRLDLSNTKLAVLSACETALGHIDPVEGVWGLQRAFKQAGVQTIVMSLWKIPDQPTQLLMQSFYSRLLAGMEIRHALREAQNELIQNGYKDPYYWASFVVLD